MVTQAKILPPSPVSPHPICGCNGDEPQAFVPISSVLSSEQYPLSSIVFSGPETVSRERITLARGVHLEKPLEPIDLSPQGRHFSGHSLNWHPTNPPFSIASFIICAVLYIFCSSYASASPQIEIRLPPILHCCYRYQMS